MKIKLIKENKNSDKVHAKATYLQDKEGYPKDQAYAIAYQYEEDGKLEEMSAAGAVHGGVHIPSEDKEELKELFSTSDTKGGIRLRITFGNKEHSGHVERSQYQGLKNVMESE